MAKQLLENPAAEQEANEIGAKFAGSSNVAEEMGKAYDYDFSDVKMHGGAEGDKMASGANDVAYTQGNDVYFGSGLLESNSRESKFAQGHELTHVMQQNEGTGVSEHVSFGESQGLFGWIKNKLRSVGSWFKGIFSKKKNNDEDWVDINQDEEDNPLRQEEKGVIPTIKTNMFEPIINGAVLAPVTASYGDEFNHRIDRANRKIRESLDPWDKVAAIRRLIQATHKYKDAEAAYTDEMHTYLKSLAVSYFPSENDNEIERVNNLLDETRKENFYKANNLF